MKCVAQSIENIEIDATGPSCFEFANRRLPHARKLGELDLSQAGGLAANCPSWQTRRPATRKVARSGRAWIMQSELTGQATIRRL